MQTPPGGTETKTGVMLVSRIFEAVWREFDAKIESGEEMFKSLYGNFANSEKV